MRKYLNIRANIALGLIIAFLLNSFGPLPYAQADEFVKSPITYSAEGELRLPAPGVMVPLSPAFNPPILKGLKINPNNPFRFDFILDQGDSVIPANAGIQDQEQLKTEASKLIKYFLASLTIPEKDLWVNLSPYEKDRIIPQSFGLTEMGRDLLAEDYMLKQITASLIYPEGETGKKFWKRIYEEAQKKFGTTNIPVNTFNKVWIVPEKAVVYENAKAGTAYVVEAKLKVMLEEDYLSLSHHQQNNSHTIASQIIRQIIIPELTREVNQDKNFSQLRQVYNSLILATWYKKKIKDSILEQVYADKNKIQGLVILANAGIQNKNNVEFIYQRYLQAFKKGVYNYIKEEQDPITQEPMPRKYFSGGLDFAMASDPKGLGKGIGHLLTIIKNIPAAILGRSKGQEIVSVNIDSIVPKDVNKIKVIDPEDQARNDYTRLQKGLFLLQGHYMKDYGETLVSLMKSGTISKTDKRLNAVLKQLASGQNQLIPSQGGGSFGWEYVYEQIAVKAIREKVVSKGDGHLEQWLKDVVQKQEWETYAKIVIEAIKAGLMDKNDQLVEDALANTEKAKKWEEYCKIILEAMRAGLLEKTDKRFRQAFEQHLSTDNTVMRYSTGYISILFTAIEIGALDKTDECVNLLLNLFKAHYKFSGLVDFVRSALTVGMFEHNDKNLEGIIDYITIGRRSQMSLNEDNEVYIILDAIKAGVLSKTDKRVKEALEELERSYNFSTYKNVFFQAIELGVFNDDHEYLEIGLKYLKKFSQREYGEALVAAIKAGALKNDDKRLDQELKEFAKKDDRYLYEDLTFKAVEERLLKPGDVRLDAWLKPVAQQGRMGTYVGIIVRALRAKVIDKQDKRWGQWLEQIRLFTNPEEYAQYTAEIEQEGMDVFNTEYINKIQQKADAQQIPLNFAIALENNAKENNADIKTIQALGERILEQVKTANEEPGLRDDQRIDINGFENYVLFGVANLGAISINVAQQLLDRYLNQRGYLPLLNDMLASVAFLDTEEVEILKKFYEGQGIRFVNSPDLLLQLAGYADAYKQSGLGLKEFTEDLMKPAATSSDLLDKMWKRIINALAKELNIKINAEQVQGRDILKEWDMRFLGQLIATQGAWDGQEKEFFKLLLKSSLEGNTSGIIDPPSYKNFPIETYGKENVQTVERIRNYNLSLLKQMQEKKLDLNTWLRPNEAVKPEDLYEHGVQRRGIDILRDFRKQQLRLQDWVKKEGGDLPAQWEEILKGLGPWAAIDEANVDPARMMNNRGALKNLHPFLRRVEDHFGVGRTPKVVADMKRILGELENFDRSKPVVKDFLRLRFWDRQPGRDMFLGNCAGSCTSLGSNASAVFQFILDQGTSYVVVEDQRGMAKGYARFFLALNEKDEPVIFVDSIDGNLARAHQDKLIKHIEALAIKVGIDAEHLKLRVGTGIKSKLGGSLLHDYSHHAGKISTYSLGNADLDLTWEPTSGWPQDTTLVTQNQAMASQAPKADGAMTSVTVATFNQDKVKNVAGFITGFALGRKFSNKDVDAVRHEVGLYIGKKDLSEQDLGDILKRLTDKLGDKREAQWLLDAAWLTALYGLNQDHFNYLRQHLTSIESDQGNDLYGLMADQGGAGVVNSFAKVRPIIATAQSLYKRWKVVDGLEQDNIDVPVNEQLRRQVHVVIKNIMDVAGRELDQKYKNFIKWAKVSLDDDNNSFIVDPLGVFIEIVEFKYSMANDILSSPDQLKEYVKMLDYILEQLSASNIETAKNKAQRRIMNFDQDNADAMRLSEHKVDLLISSKYFDDYFVEHIRSLKAAYLQYRATLATVYDLGDMAMGTSITSSPKDGGIDLTSANMNLQTKHDGEGIKFYLDPAQLAQLQNATGFVPVIINIQPLKSLADFLEIKNS